MADPAGVLIGVDVSHHQEGIDVSRLNVDFVIARTAQVKGGKYGTTVDRAYATHKANAGRGGKLFSAYLYLGNGETAARNAAIHASIEPDRSVPVMVDWEEGSGNVAFLRECIAALQALGYRVWGTYAPQWYLNGAGGGGSLAGLPGLVSSKYPDMAPGDAISEYRDVPTSSWNGYGGNTVIMVQFTSTGRDPAYTATNLDMDAYRGTRAQLAALWFGATPTPAPQEDTDMPDRELMPTTGKDACVTAVVPRTATTLVVSQGWVQMQVKKLAFFGHTAAKGLTQTQVWPPADKPGTTFPIDPARNWEVPIPADQVTVELTYALPVDPNHDTTGVLGFR